MFVKKLEEYGYESAIMGMGLSYKPFNADLEEFYTPERMARLHNTAVALSKKSGSERKFLRLINTTWYIKATRKWWTEMATYCIGSVRLSESTVHMIHQRPLDVTDFEYVSPEALDELNEVISIATGGYTKRMSKEDLNKVKDMLPEGFLIGQIISLNYETLLRIYRDRKNHPLPEWSIFLDNVLGGIEHPEFIVHPEKEERYTRAIVYPGTSQAKITKDLFDVTGVVWVPLIEDRVALERLAGDVLAGRILHRNGFTLRQTSDGLFLTTGKDDFEELTNNLVAALNTFLVHSGDGRAVTFKWEVPDVVQGKQS